MNSIPSTERGHCLHGVSVAWRLAPLLLISLISGASAQPSEGDTRWWPFVSVGYWNAPSDVNDYYNQVLGSYRDAGIPIPAHTEFGKTLCVNGGILVSRISRVMIGLSFGYRYTPAWSGYADYAGTLNVNGTINSFEISIVAKTEVAEWLGFPVILTIEPGAGRMNAVITEVLKFTAAPQFNSASKWTASAWGFQARVTLGTSLRVAPFDVGFNVGYLATFASTTNVHEEYTSVSLNQLGPVLLLSVGFTI